MRGLRIRKDVNMTEGSITGHLVRFALPMLLGLVFQQLYNAVDSIVVGNFVSKEALAAVGTVAPIINTLIGFFSGLAAGAGVVISQNYGANDPERVKRSVQTTICITAVMSVLMTIVGVVMVPFMLQLMDTPETVFAEAKMYLTIYFAGVTGLLFYNMGSGILRAVGDSFRPLLFLILSAVLNIVLDLLFVLAFRMGVEGVAYATILAQGISAALVMIVLTRDRASYRIVWRGMRMDPELLRQILRVGLPTSIQQAITSFSNVFVQSYINFFDADCMAGWASCSKIDAFAMLPMQSIGLAATSFAGQNYGAGRMDRVRSCVKHATLLEVGTTVAISIPMLLFSRPLLMLFNQEAEVLRYGQLFLYIFVPFYSITCIQNVYANILRGVGDTRMAMFVMLGSFVAFRQVYLFIMSRVWNTVTVIAFGYPLGWILASLIMTYYFYFGGWERKLKPVKAQPETAGA